MAYAGTAHVQSRMRRHKWQRRRDIAGRLLFLVFLGACGGVPLGLGVAAWLAGSGV